MTEGELRGDGYEDDGHGMWLLTVAVLGSLFGFLCVCWS